MLPILDGAVDTELARQLTGVCSSVRFGGSVFATPELELLDKSGGVPICLLHVAIS
jgi:hypothetical protein